MYYPQINLIKSEIGWQQYNNIYTEFANNSLLDSQTHSKLTEFGKLTLETLEKERSQEILDENAKRKKLHNESIMSGWKRKTFWYIFAFGLFGGIYSGVDLFNKIIDSKKVQEKQKVKQKVKQEKDERTSKSRNVILDQKMDDSLGVSKKIQHN